MNNSDLSYCNYCHKEIIVNSAYFSFGGLINGKISNKIESYKNFYYHSECFDKTGFQSLIKYIKDNSNVWCNFCAKEFKTQTTVIKFSGNGFATVIFSICLKCRKKLMFDF